MVARDRAAVESLLEAVRVTRMTETPISRIRDALAEIIPTTLVVITVTLTTFDHASPVSIIFAAFTVGVIVAAFVQERRARRMVDRSLESLEAQIAFLRQRREEDARHLLEEASNEQRHEGAAQRVQEATGQLPEGGTEGHKHHGG